MSLTLTTNRPAPLLGPRDVRDPDRFRRVLDTIAAEGWDGPTARELLLLVRAHIVRPLVRLARLEGSAADQAEATGWAEAWRVLRRPSTRDTPSPLGLLWVVVRRAVVGEKVAAEFATQPRTAWRLRPAVGQSDEPADEGRSGPHLLSWDALTETGWETFGHREFEAPDGLLIEHLAGAFADAGWPPDLAYRVVRQIAVTAPPASELAAPSKRNEVAFGWRSLAVELGIEPWQARRATIAVLGLPGQAGLAERVVRDGVRRPGRGRRPARCCGRPSSGGRGRARLHDAARPLAKTLANRVGKGSGKTLGKGAWL